jgi:hypothetical protein
VQDNSATHTEFKDDKQSEVPADNNVITVHGLDGNYMMNKSKWSKQILAEEINTNQGSLGVSLKMIRLIVDLKTQLQKQPSNSLQPIWLNFRICAICMHTCYQFMQFCVNNTMLLR